MERIVATWNNIHIAISREFVRVGRYLWRFCFERDLWWIGKASLLEWRIVVEVGVALR